MMQFMTESVAHAAGSAEVFITFIPGRNIYLLQVNFNLVDD